MEMRYFWSLILFLLTLCSVGCAQSSEKDCKGYFRWNIKTLTDTIGLNVLQSSPANTSISELIKNRPPVRMFILSKKDGRLPRFNDECGLVKILAVVEKMNIQADHDYHIVLKEPGTAASLIGEIPDPSCKYLAKFPAQQEKFKQARIDGDAVYKRLKETKKPVLVEIVGVPFWDAPHFWIRGSSKWGREIHPVLEMKIVD